MGKRGNRNYVRGRAREYRVIRKLREQGALWVVRSYGSHGLFDITAVFPDHVRLIQVKKGYLPPKERRALEEVAQKIGVENIRVEAWVSRNGRFEVEVLGKKRGGGSTSGVSGRGRRKAGR